MQVLGTEEQSLRSFQLSDNRNCNSSNSAATDAVCGRSPHFNSKYSGNLSNANYRRWFDSMSKKSPQRAGVYHRTVSRFCIALKITPWEYSRLSLRKMEDILMDHVSRMERTINSKTGEEYSQKYIEKFVDSVKSWAEWNGKKFQRKIIIGPTNYTPVSMRERIPTQEEMSRVLYASTTPLRTRVIIAGTGHGGLRFMSYGDFRGTDGLRLKDFPELKIVCDNETGLQKEVVFQKLPSFVTIRWNLSKIRKEYRAPVSEEEAEMIVQWLNSRIRAGEFLNHESGIIVTTEATRRRLRIPQEKLGVSDRSRFLCSGKVSQLVRVAMRASGLPWRSYVWRSYFDSVLTAAESKGWITHAFQQFLMGHEGDIERTYSLNKKQLPDYLTEELRESYRKCQTLLQTKTTNADLVNEEKARKISKISMFMSLGFSEKEIEEQKLLEKKEEELIQIVKTKITDCVSAARKPQLFVKSEEVDLVAKDGYRWVGNLSDGRCVMEPV